MSPGTLISGGEFEENKLSEYNIYNKKKAHTSSLNQNIHSKSGLINVRRNLEVDLEQENDEEIQENINEGKNYSPY